jgi:hypothetical protein
MKIAFLIRHASNYRLLGVVIDRALEAGYEVEIWPDHGFPTTGTKKYLAPAEAGTPTFEHGRPVVRGYDGPDDLVRRLDTSDADAVVSLIPLRDATGGGAPQRHPAWVMLQTGPDTFSYASEHLATADLLMLQSPWWLDWGIVNRSIQDGGSDVALLRARIEPLCRFVGYPEVETLPLVDRNAVRARWGIPIDQPVVVLLPFPQGVGKQSFWPKKIFGEPSRARRLFNVVAHRELDYLGAAWGRKNDVDVVRAIRAFCDRNGAFLLAKSRRKTPIPDYLRAVADKCVYDEGFYPPTIVEALSVASLCLSYFSLGVLEATVMGVPHICVPFRSKDYLNKYAGIRETTYYDTLFHRQDGGLFEFKGVTRTMSPAELIAELPTRTFEDFRIDPAAQRQYLKKFFGETDGRAAARTVEAIARVVEERRARAENTAGTRA